MKNVIKKSILFATLFTTMLGSANEISVSPIKEDLRPTTITIGNVKEGNLLSIIDKNGLVLYNELIEQTGRYSKKFDLTLLPDSDYLFEVHKDFKIETIPFTVKANKVTFKKEDKTIIFKPLIRTKGNRIYVSKLTLNHAPLKIKLYYYNSNNKYDLIYAEEIKNVQNINRVYKLDEKVKGNYQIILNSEGKEFSENIHI